MKIAIVDDTKTDLERVRNLLESYALNHPRPKLQLTCFDHPDDFLKAYSVDPDYDLILLDMVMPFVNGIQVGQAIRKIDDQVKIIYITISKEYALYGYDVKAYHYLIKPVSEKALFQVLHEISAQLDHDRQRKLIIKDKESIHQLTLDKIAYIEVMRHRLFYHLRDGSVLSAYGSLKEISELIIGDPGFLRIHKSFLINLHAVSAIRQREFVMRNEAKVPISRKALKSVRAAYYGFIIHQRSAW